MLSKDDINKCPSIFHNAFSNPVFIERVLLIIYAIIFLIGLVGNIMTIIIIKCNTHLRTPTNIYLLNLAVSDLMMLICNLPLEMIEIHFREWPLSIMFCTLRNICVEFFTCSSILTILAFSCERYFAIVHPIHFHQLNRFHRAQNVVIIIWFLSLIVSIPIGFSYEVEKNLVVISPYSTRFILKSINNTNFQRLNETILSINVYCKSCVPKKNLIKLLSIIMIITSICCFYFPMIIIGIIYIYIIKALHHVNKYEKHSNHIESNLSSLSNCDIKGKKQTISTSFYSNIINQEKVIQIKQKHTHLGSHSWLKSRAHYQARKVVVKTLVTVVIAFFICYAPLYLQRVLSAIMSLNSNLYSDSYIFSNIMAYLYVISGITFYFGSIINPILYNVVSNKYRRAFRDLFCCRLTYKTTTNIKNQQKLFQTNHQQIHSFVKKFPYEQSNNINRKLCFNLHEENFKNNNQIRILPITKCPMQSDIQSIRSNSSSISSYTKRELYRAHFLRSNPSLPKKMSSTQSCEISLGEKNYLAKNSQLTPFHS
ncbi:unnamed protein product [Rotaria sordida]|uniref:G-protein coupled receptors family 1 profile domain-containing protein n=1 Tax=Rotaria sordida TaxID=392033 RepID=A0A818GSG2_9BILA|nr:unnamed protein product [Rotaria sordida]